MTETQRNGQRGVANSRRAIGTKSHRPQKTALLLAQRIVSDITDRGLEPGQMLASEKEMLAEYEVGRGTLRESLRFLEMQGVLRIKPGPGGGPVVTAPSYRNLASTIALLLQLSDAPFRDIVEVRLVLEPSMASQAARRIDPEHLDEIKVTLDAMAENLEDLDIFLAENEKFHDLIAWSTGNHLFGYLVESLHWITDGTALGVEYPLERRQHVLKAHTRIYEAIKAKDEAKAAKAMADHIAQFGKYLEREYPQIMETPLRWESLF